MAALPRHSVSVAAVITDPQDRVLVIQRRDNGAWQIPGGILELHETLEDGVRREVEEETGVIIEPTALTGIYKNVDRGTIAFVFRATHLTGTPHPTEESAAVAWWPLTRVRSDIDHTFAPRILDALHPAPTPHIRHHNGTHFLHE